MQINGVFCRSKDGDAELIFGMVFLVVLGAFGAFGILKSTWRDGYNMDFWIAIAFLQVPLATVLGILWWRFNTKYRIESGHIIALTRGEKVRWSESIAAIQGVAIVIPFWRNSRWLLLKWPGKSRRIELFDTLAAELRV